MTAHMTAQYDPYDFANRRHIGPTHAEIDAMLSTSSRRRASKP